MKNLIAISAAALTAATASAGYVNTVSLASWTSQGSNGSTATDNPQGPGYAVAGVYTDTLHNATYSAGTVSGGHGLGVYTMTNANAATSVFATGTFDNTNIGGSNTSTSSFTSFTFTFSQSGPSAGNPNFMGGVGFAFTISPGQSLTVTASYGSGSATTGTYPAAGGTNLFVGFWSSGGEGIDSVTFTASSATATTITITDIYYGLVPAPGAAALLGVAGLVGSRRRRA